MVLGDCASTEGEGQTWECQPDAGALKGEWVTPKLSVNADSHREQLLGFQEKGLVGGRGPGRHAGWLR